MHFVSTSRPERPIRCARCKRSFWTSERGAFYCPTCTRGAELNEKALIDNAALPALDESRKWQGPR